MSPRPLISLNPFNEQVLAEFAPDTPAQLDGKLAAAAEIFSKWRQVPFRERAARMREAGAVLEQKREDLAKLMSLEMGKPLRAAVQEVEKCAFACRYYAENAESFLENEPVNAGDGRAFVSYQPLGPVLAIMPWNFPFWQVFRFAAPALMAGNVGLLKHASNVPQCALAIEEVFQLAGFPPGTFQTLLTSSAELDWIIADERVRAVTLTGSVEAGASVAALAGRHIKKTVLELGGSDPFIVMPSADLESAARTAVQARVINNGQSCIAAKRFIVHRAIASSFQQRFTELMAALKLGDPLDLNTDIGPLATAEVAQGLEVQVERSLQMGAEALLGGKRRPGRGFFYPPTVLRRIPPGSPAATEELFGPVACMFEAKDMAEAIRTANGTVFGLAACAWTRDSAEQDLFVRDIESGAAFINGMVASDPRLPFGGVKRSGYGRELSYHGIREFVNTKTVRLQV